MSARSGKFNTELIERAVVRALLEELNDTAELWKLATAADLGALLTDPVAKAGWRNLAERGGSGDWVALFASEPQVAAALHGCSDGFTTDYNFRQWLATLQDAAARRKLEAAIERARALPVAEAAEVLEEAAKSAKGNLSGDLDACQWKPDEEPDDRPAIATFCDKVHLRRGNVSQVTAKAKSGKTSFLTGLMAATVAPGTSADCLGWSCEAPQGAILFFDFEQSRDDFIFLCRWIFKRLHLDPRNAPQFRAYRLRDKDMGGRLNAIREAANQAREEVGAVALIITDGAADLIADVNASEESNKVVDSLLQMSTHYDCHLVAVVHSNEALQSGKDARGHLGKQLMRKCEATFVLEKEGDQVQVHTLVHRKAGISAKNPFTFAWSEDAGGFVSNGFAESFKAAAKDAELTELALQVAQGNPHMAMRAGELAEAIMQAEGCVKRTAERRIAAMKSASILTFSAVTGYYHLGEAPTRALQEAKPA